MQKKAARKTVKKKTTGKTAGVQPHPHIAFTHLHSGGHLVVFVHGLTANRHIFTQTAEFLHRHGFSTVAYDLRGRGDSFKPHTEYSTDVHVNDLRNLIEHLKYPKPVILIGHSFGAGIALEYAKRFRSGTAALILLDGGANLTVWQRLKIYAAILPSLKRIGKVFSSREAFLAEVKKTSIIRQWTPAAERFLLTDLEDCEGGVCSRIPAFVIQSELQSLGADSDPRKFALKILKNPLTAYRQAKQRAPFPFYAVNCPVLILRAEHYNFRPGDQILPLTAAENMKNQIPVAELRSYPLNHYELVLSENHDRDEAILNFLYQLPHF